MTQGTGFESVQPDPASSSCFLFSCLGLRYDLLASHSCVHSATMSPYASRTICQIKLVALDLEFYPSNRKVMNTVPQSSFLVPLYQIKSQEKIIAII